MLQKHLFNLMAHRIDRIQRGHRILEDHCDFLTADIADLSAGTTHGSQLYRIITCFGNILDRTTGNIAIAGQKLHNRMGSLALSTTGFTNDTKGFPPLQVEGYAIYRMHFFLANSKFRLQITDF